jgi:hypothetical protein
MATDPRHPFSDLTPEQLQSLIRAAHRERARAIRSFFSALFGRRHEPTAWPRRQREAQVWPPKNVPALSLTVYR